MPDSIKTENLSEAQDNGTIEQNQTNLIINYLPPTHSQNDVYQLFSSYGAIEHCKLITDKTTGQSLGYAFVKFENSESAQKAVAAANGLRILSKTIKVSYARPSSDSIKAANLYVSGLPKTYTPDDLQKLFQDFGNIVTTRILSDNTTGLSKGVGFVRFDQREQAESAIAALHNKSVPGCDESKLTVKYATQNQPQHRQYNQQIQQQSMPVVQHNRMPYVNAFSQPQQQSFGRPPVQLVQQMTQIDRIGGPIHTSQSSRYTNRYTPIAPFSMHIQELSPPEIYSEQSMVPENEVTLFVYNMPSDAEENHLYRLFSPYGAITKVSVVKDAATGRCKGYCFVTMRHQDDATAAILALDGLMHKDRKLQVSFKKDGASKVALNNGQQHHALPAFANLHQSPTHKRRQFF